MMLGTIYSEKWEMRGGLRVRQGNFGLAVLPLNTQMFRGDLGCVSTELCGFHTSAPV